MIRYTLSLLLLIGTSAAMAQTGYKLQFYIEGLKDTTIYLGYYYGESTYVRDTAHIDSKGNFVFDGNKPLPRGVHFLILDRTRLFEFVIGKQQHFSMQTKNDDYVSNMKVQGDPDNQLFFENLRFNMDRNKEAEPYIKTLNNASATEADKAAAREAFTRINEKVLEHQKQLIQKNPELVTAKLINSGRKLDIPDAPVKANGFIDSTFQFRYYRAHFFDHFDLSDDAMIRMPRPMYSEKVNEYLDKLFVQQADTLLKATEWLITKARKNEETYKYMVWLLAQKYWNPEIMGLDEVFVNINDKYFASGQMDFWANANLKKSIQEQADRMRLSMVGKSAPNLILGDANKQMRALHDIKKKYTVLYIYDPECGHCKKETPKLVEFLNKTKHDVGVYTVCTDTSLVKMKKYIADMKMEKFTNTTFYYSAIGHYSKLYDAPTTPTIYIIDEKKKIIAKKFPGAERIEEFITNYERMIKAQASLK
ncbi:MAG TPA: thioredoxin-like domain-containing protein [Cyclobacteriaceae bacterium]|nr:thioredoxin-like domain-containing protein [Cyclobacteriaceae bacterium]